MAEIIFHLLSDEYGINEKTWDIIYHQLVKNKKRDMAYDIDRNLVNVHKNRVMLTNEVMIELKKCYL